MPSRRKSKKPRRRGNRETTIDTQPPHSNSFVYETTIEEDLRQQRLRQQQKEQQNKQQQERIQKEAERKRNEEAKEEQEQESIDGLDEEDQQRRRQPRQSPIHLEHLYSGGGGCTTTTTALRNKPSLFSTNLSSPWFGSLEEQSPRLGPHNRQRIRQTWHSKHLLENLNLNPRAYSFYGKQSLSSLSKRWMEYSLPDGTHCSWDLACKRVLHPSARTLDVAMFDDDDGNNNNNNNNTTQLPTIATPVQGGWGLFRPPKGGVNRVLTLKGKPVQSIRMHESSRRCGTIVRGHHPYSAWTFRYYPLPHAMSYTEVAILEPAHDFCFGTDLVLFACPRYSATSNALNPLFLPLREGSTTGGGGGGGSAELRTLNVQNFPQSDALRVELSCSGNEKYVAFGHRNGQVSLLDLRQSHTTTSILQYYDAGSSSSSSVPNNGMLGSACDLAFLKQSPNQLLVKRSFGSCQLHDLRKSTSNRVPRNVSASSSVVSHLTVPEEELHRTLSSNCNGFAIDPTSEQSLIAPYVNQQHQACLGIWSLGTGCLVGSKTLVQNNPERDVIHMEVCQRTTPVVETHHKLKLRQQPNTGSSSSFGIWLKCGRFSKGKLDSKFGSLHHVTFS